MINLIKAYFKYFSFLILLAAAYIFWQIYGDLFNSWLFTVLKMKESDLMPYFKMAFPGILFLLTFITGINFGREYERKNKTIDPGVLFECFREFLNQRDVAVSALLRFQTLDDDSINKWFTNTRDGLLVALGKNFSSEIVAAPLGQMSASIENLKGHNTTRGQRMLVLTICRDQLGSIKEKVRPELLVVFNPSNLKFYEI